MMDGLFVIVFLFFFSSRRRHTRCLSDWSSDVCSSDLGLTKLGLTKGKDAHFEKNMTPEELANKNYDAVLAEKRDKLNSRLQIWSLLLALISGFGVASVQEGNTSLVVALYPLLAACLAHFTAHS